MKKEEPRMRELGELKAAATALRDAVEENLGAILLAVMASLLFVGYLWATPNQLSAEADYAAHEEARLAQ